MKLCVIGGAGARSAFLTKSLVKSTRDIRVDHIVLLDNDQQKLKTYGEISRELSRRLDPDLTFEVTSDARAALTGVDYIITTIRAGGDAGRLFDEQTWPTAYWDRRPRVPEASPWPSGPCPPWCTTAPWPGRWPTPAI